MNIAQIEENVRALLSRIAAGELEQSDFIYELLLAYGHRKQSVTRLRSGERNLSAKGGTPRHDEITWKRNLYFKHIDGDELHAEIDQIRKEKRVTTNKIRFVIVTNFNQLLAVDTKTSDTLDIQFDELPKQFDFFLPWAGMEKAVYQGENPADVKAAEKMAKLFDLIKGDNFDESNKDDAEALHNLNVFLTRLLFCFFSEDTEIFSDNQFSLGVESHTKEDGGDLSSYLNRLFVVLNTSDAERGELPDYLANFPYVNGGLFADDIPSPVFSAKSRRMLIECGSELDWSDINPDIFGSMIQAVVHPDQRGGMGMHYTSVTNIMKVIEPLFLNDLYEELEKVESSTTKLQKLQQRLGEIKIFDPACGSGNFLIIAYKELRKLEMEVLKRLQELELEKTGQISQPFSVIKLSQFYGIELDDFAHEVAILSLWLAEHQMNLDFKTEFGDCPPSLPLKSAGSLISGNAIIIDWVTLCSRDGEVYILGNPPYLGTRNQKLSHKEDISTCLSSIKNYKSLDYIACWFIKASKYIEGINAAYAFVSTNSICQGDQVGVFWSNTLADNLEINFAYQSFNWSNSAKSNAGVTCVIVGVSNKTSLKSKKFLYTQGIRRVVGNINGYLLDADNIFISRQSKPISPDFPKMIKGSIPADGGHLILDESEFKSLSSYDEIRPFLKKFIGSQESINGINRWCLYLSDSEYKVLQSHPEIKEIMDGVSSMRLASTKRATRELASFPNRFAEDRYYNRSCILIPCVSSGNRDYIPISIIDKGPVIYASAQAIYDFEMYIFGILNSRMHMAWVKTVAGRLRSDYRYSSALCYNAFPIPVLTDNQKLAITEISLEILSVRELYSHMHLSSLYSSSSMPADLRETHSKLDAYIDKVYSNNNFSVDEERLEVLFSMYSKITGGKNA